MAALRRPRLPDHAARKRGVHQRRRPIARTDVRGRPAGRRRRAPRRTASPCRRRSSGAVELVFVNGRFAPDAVARAPACRPALVVESLADGDRRACRRWSGAAPGAPRGHPSDDAFTALNTAFVRGRRASSTCPRGCAARGADPPALSSPSRRQRQRRRPSRSTRACWSSRRRGARRRADRDPVRRHAARYFTNAVTELVGRRRRRRSRTCKVQRRGSPPPTTSPAVHARLEAGDSQLRLARRSPSARRWRAASIDSRARRRGRRVRAATASTSPTARSTSTTTPTIDHAQPHGTSHELYKGILDGQRHTASSTARCFVRADAQKTDAQQTNQQPAALRRRPGRHQAAARDLRRRRASAPTAPPSASSTRTASSTCARAASARRRPAAC